MKQLVIDGQAVVNDLEVIKERAGSAVIYGVLTGEWAQLELDSLYARGMPKVNR